MSLEGKKIAFVIPVIPRAVRRMALEAVRLKRKGANLMIYLLPLQHQDEQIVRETVQMLKKMTGQAVTVLWEGLKLHSMKGLDMIIVSPCPPFLLAEFSEQDLLENMSLVLAPCWWASGGQEVFSYIKRLLKKERTYFVPFGFIPTEKKDSSLHRWHFFSRLDLVVETAEAAASETQFQPAVLDQETFPV